jgi:hypothetical protein
VRSKVLPSSSLSTELREDGERRRHGAFFTPPLWAAAGLGLLDVELGAGWEQDAIVWDPCCGSGNLTRGRDFPDLVLSTLEPSDLAISGSAPRHQSALSFVWDFLGDPRSLPPEVASRLRAAARDGKRLVFLANPPYATAGNLVLGAAKKTHVASGQANEDMLRAGLGRPSQQLYAQFMYRFSVLADDHGFSSVSVGLFSKPSFLTASSFGAFRSFWFGRFSFDGGFLFRADEFADVSPQWGVSFTLWSEGETDLSAALSLDLLKSESESGSAERRVLQQIGTKVLYNATGRRANDWARGPRQAAGVDGIQLRSGLNVSEAGRGRQLPGHRGWLNNDSNDVYHSARTVWLQSGGKSSGQNNAGWFLDADNFVRSLALFAARKAVVGTWVNDKDEFLGPRPEVEQSPEFGSWTQAALVYAAVHPQNTCCGARGLPYRGVPTDLENHLFWASPDRVAALAADFGVAALDADARRPGTATPALVSTLGRSAALDSARARDCWALLQDLLRGTMQERVDFAVARPELYSLCWDSGLFQLKDLFSSAEPLLWRELRQATAALRAEVAEGVYRFELLLR